MHVIKKNVNIFLFCLLFLIISGCWETERVQKTGVIMNNSKEGFFFRAYEAELSRVGFKNGSRVNGASSKFSIEKEDLNNKLTSLMNKNNTVVINFGGGRFCFPEDMK